MPSAGCTWITSRFESKAACGPPANIMCGGGRNWMTICVVWQAIALPLRSRNGTPCQRQLSMHSRTTPKVAVWLSGGTLGSSRYLRYWPRMVAPKTSSRVIGRIARSTLTFSSRTESASKRAGDSMAVSVRSCRRWFWNMSRSTPTPS